MLKHVFLSVHPEPSCVMHILSDLKDEGLSRMKGNFRVQFIGGWRAVMSPGYPRGWQR
jgi:hypothetical protein